MKEYFVASLCKNGILGGGIVLNSDSIIYHTGKVTIPNKYKKIEMKYEDITKIEMERQFFFPIIVFVMNNEDQYKFVVFARKRFIQTLNEMKVIK